MSGYVALTLRVPEAEAELAAAELWALGMLGLESRDEPDRAVLIAYFDLERFDREAFEREGVLARRGAELVSLEPLEERDWLADYRRAAVPFALGSAFWVEPGEPGPGVNGKPVPEGRHLLRLPARTAFGTGSHESTRLAVDLLEPLQLEGWRVLDVGTGSGVLAFVALHLGAASVLGVECDPAAALVARQNQDLNRRRFPLIAGRVGAVDEASSFDLALVNVIPERVEPDLPAIASRLVVGGRALFSGCLGANGSRYRTTLSRHGFSVERTLDCGEWTAFSTRRESR